MYIKLQSFKPLKRKKLLNFIQLLLFSHDLLWVLCLDTPWLASQNQLVASLLRSPFLLVFTERGFVSPVAGLVCSLRGLLVRTPSPVSHPVPRGSLDSVELAWQTHLFCTEATFVLNC